MNLLNDFLCFSRQSIISRDIDPIYDVIKASQDEMRLTKSQGIEHSMLFVASCNLVTAQRLWEENGSFSIKDSQLRYPCGYQRRGLRDYRQMRLHFMSVASYVEKHGGWLEWMTYGWGDNPIENWSKATDRFKEVHQNGRWAAYKGCELLQKVNLLPLSPPDMGHENSSGPRRGLERLFPEAEFASISRLNVISEQLYQQHKEQVGWNDIAEAETSLCDFNSMCNGGYYIGYDMDDMLEICKDSPITMRSRLASLPHNYLGEIGGWHGIDKARCKWYNTTGKVAIR